MGNSNWSDRIVGDRMTVDQQFMQRVNQSEFSRQEWGLIMTAVEFEIENPENEERAALVANTSKIPHVIPELKNVQSQMGGMGGERESSGGVLSSIKDALGLGNGGDGNAAKTESATALAEEYAAELQAHLEEEGKWDDVRTAAAR